MATEYHMFNPNLTNELRLGYNRYNDLIPSGNYEFPGLDQFPEYRDSGHQCSSGAVTRLTSERHHQHLSDRR